jgi:hypothetical protein
LGEWLEEFCELNLQTPDCVSSDLHRLLIAIDSWSDAMDVGGLQFDRPARHHETLEVGRGTAVDLATVAVPQPRGVVAKIPVRWTGGQAAG